MMVMVMVEMMVKGCIFNSRMGEVWVVMFAMVSPSTSIIMSATIVGGGFAA